ncbi:transcription termination factor MTERF2, chloroplastic isoform X1 [Typha latifolia]|uniref:transcription termination factor MTERF2, chloroplastic isoform X1 n=1 Tax=Typha latifolia TaxID=4733 RepID=UPI003C3052EB
MLSHHHFVFLHGFLHPNPNPNPNPFLLFPTPSSRKPLSSFPIRALDSDNQPVSLAPFEPDQEPNTSLLSRRQNANSTGLLLLHSETLAQSTEEDIEDREEEEEVRRKVAEEVSLATRRNPRFPGSIDFPKAGRLDPPPDLRLVLGSDDRVLKRALEVRRGVAAETLKVALRAGKLSVTYSTNLVSKLSDFVDHVVIEAAALKGVPEFSHMSFNARARSYIESSGVVPLVKWLKHNSLTYPQIGKVICMCSGNLVRVRLIVDWLKSIHVKGEFLGIVLVKGGFVSSCSLEALEDIVDYLEENGVRREWVGYVVSRCPQMLSLTMEELETRVKFYMDMGLDRKDFGTMVFDYPKALGFFSMEDMNSKVQYLKEFGLSGEGVGRLLAFKPQLMGCSIEERWKPLVKYLYYLGVPRDGMKRILMVKPMIFCVDLETTIAPKVRFLQDIGIRDEAIGGVLVKFPSILTYSLYKKIRPVVIFLMTKAGVSQKDIGKVIALDPQLVGCSIIKKLEVNVNYFLSLGIRLHSLGEMIADFPMLLRYNLDILRPKYRYLRRIMVRPLQDLIEFPRFFSYSLDGRIAPRHQILVANRINFKLRYMLVDSDEGFNKRVQAAVERREKFEAGKANLEMANSDSAQVASTTP